MRTLPFFAKCCIVATALLAFLIPAARAQDRQARLWPWIILPPQREPGKPMELREMSVQSRIVGLHVETTTTLAFFNPNQRQLEGDLVFPLPAGAIVTGYALDVNGNLRDGVVVKKEKARVTFETEVRRGVDPGLVEQVAGNVYRTRIFPLPAQGIRRIQLRYVAELSANEKGDAAWHLPLPIGETVGKLAIRVEVSQGAVTPEIGGFGNLRFKTFENQWVAETAIDDAKPGEDLWVALPKLPPQVSALERTADGDTFFAISDLPGPAPAASEQKAPEAIGIAWDASGSRAGEHLQKEIAVLRELFKKWPKLEVSLLVFRDRPEAVRVFHGDLEGVIKTLNELAYDGGTDLSFFEGVGPQTHVNRWLLFTDGFDTLSGKLPEFGKLQVTAIVSQTAADRELLRQACAGSGGQLIDLQRMEPAEAAAAIVSPPPAVTGVEGTGIAEVQGIGKTVQGRVSIHGKLLADEAQLSLTYSDGRHSPPFKLVKKSATPGVLLAAVWAAERVTQLSVRAEDNEDELLALGHRFGVVSPVTSLIVLETVDQYARNDIEPPASEPELRQQWLDRKAVVAKQGQQERASKLDRVLAMWTERVKWWEEKHEVSADFRLKSAKKRYRGGEEGLSTAPAPSMPFSSSAAPPVAQAQRPSDEFSSVPGAANHLDAAPRAPVTRAGGAAAAKDEGSAGGGAGAAITVKPWDPATPYLAALKAVAPGERYKIYLEQRKTLAGSPAFFVDCGEYFMREGDAATGVRVLTNLAELKLENAPMLRILAWRLQQAGEFDRAIVLLRKVVKLRPEEPQSFRDLALALAERGKAKHSASDLTEAMTLFQKVVMGEWQRFPEIEVVALEELNALIAWVRRAAWEKQPTIPALDERLLKNLDVDVRIVMSWDADATDVDLHVGEPSGQEAFYAQNRTAIGGLVSKDFTQGYGPEEYMLRRAQPGAYKVFTHYYGSSQQTIIGPTTITATIFTDFGRANEKKQVLTLRLDKPREKADMGEIQIGGGKAALHEGKPEEQSRALGREAFRALRVGQTPDEVKALVGEPIEKKDGVWIYKTDGREYRVAFKDGKSVVSVREILPGAEMILVE